MLGKTQRPLPLAAIFLAALPFLGHRMQANAADVTVNVASTKQVIDGFGASSAWCGKIPDNVMNSLYGDLGYSILRVRIEEGIEDNWKTGNFSKWADELANAKKATAKGAIVFATPWNAPTSLRLNTGGASAKYSTDPTKWATYRDYLNSYVKYFKDNSVNLYAISVQNEPDYAKDWTYWSATQDHDFILNYGATINTKLISAESFSYNKSYYDQILNDPKALANVAIFGTHLYGTSVSNYAYPLLQQKGVPAGKKLWMTEHYLNSDDDITKTIMPVAKEIHDCMVTGNMNAYTYWWITWPNGLATSSGTIFKRAYVIGQFSKYIRPGYTRVDASATPATNVYVSAYTGDNKVVIVAVNTGTSAVSQKFAIQNGTVAQFASTYTSASTNMAAGPSANVSGGSFTANLPAQSITTFLGSRTDKIPTAVETQTRIDNSFRAEISNGHMVITPASNSDTYSFSIYSPNGKKAALRTGNRGVSEIPVSTRGMYLVEIHANGIVQRKMVPLL
jgi:glucuronoarabinoxylan endo-1,4-beta-xylanase